MKKLLSTITVIAILGILVAVGFFGYNKYQEVELEKNKLQAQQKENDNSSSQSTSETDNSQNQMNENQNNNQEQEQSTTGENQEKVTRNNVFDYLFAGLEQNYEDGFDKSKITFQEPTQDENGNWKIMANNKSGHGSYVFEVTPNGLVQTINNAGEVEDSVQVNLN